MSFSRRVSVVGLGYVGLPVAVAFGRHGEVVGFDVDSARVAQLREGRDRTGEIDPGDLAATRVHFTSEAIDLQRADFHIVAVPTPIDEMRRPDFGPLISASEVVGATLKTGDIVVYESTVYPGATEEHCVPVLERASGLRCGTDFTIGYSPERINPGDRKHRFESICKVVAGSDAATLEIVAQAYAMVVDAGVYRAASIRVAEAAKVIENTQRDINIALMNELALIFARMGLDTRDVLAAARTKWNFLPFEPGLVGGHCIGVDPYYLMHAAAAVDYAPEVINAGRRTNDNVGEFIARRVLQRLWQGGTPVDGRFVVNVLGLAFKEDVPDLRNSRVIDVIETLRTHGVVVRVYDPVVDPADAHRIYGVKLETHPQTADGVVLAVAHESYRNAGWEGLARHLRPPGLVFDVKGVLDRTACPDGVTLLRL
ncbi:MAG: nucleotide sugar dehydrogenase [Pseudomonadota bacterium]